MKRWIHASRVVEESSRTKIGELNHDAVDKVLDYVENACRTATTHEGINIEIDAYYSKFTQTFQISCKVMGGSFIETPQGREVAIEKSGHYQKPELVNPRGFDSEYGFISMEGKLPDAYLDTFYSNVNYRLLFLNVSSSSFDDCIITDADHEEIKISDINRILEDNLNRLGYQLDKLIDVAYERAVRDFVEDQKATAEEYSY